MAADGKTSRQVSEVQEYQTTLEKTQLDFFGSNLGLS